MRGGHPGSGIKVPEGRPGLFEGADKWQMDHSGDLAILAAELVVAWLLLGRLNGVAGGASSF